MVDFAHFLRPKEARWSLTMHWRAMRFNYTKSDPGSIRKLGLSNFVGSGSKFYPVFSQHSGQTNWLGESEAQQVSINCK